MGRSARPLYIFDLDGTIANIEHRRHLVQKAQKQHNWKAFFAACRDDKPNAPIIEIMESLSSHAEIWIWSGRSDEVRYQTEAWILQNCLLACQTPAKIHRTLKMRAQKDFTPDEILKRRWLDEMRQADRDRLVAVFDDRDKVVAMWRAAGVTCCQVASGDF